MIQETNSIFFRENESDVGFDESKKNIFESGVFYFIWNYIVLIFIVKVRDSSASEDRSAIPSRPATSKPAEATASDILGLKRKKGSHYVSLEMEVDQYLSNPNSGTSILDFWQVVSNYI